MHILQTTLGLQAKRVAEEGEEASVWKQRIALAFYSQVNPVCRSIKFKCPYWCDTNRQSRPCKRHMRSATAPGSVEQIETSSRRQHQPADRRLHAVQSRHVYNFHQTHAVDFDLAYHWTAFTLDVAFWSICLNNGIDIINLSRERFLKRNLLYQSWPLPHTACGHWIFFCQAIWSKTGETKVPQIRSWNLDPKVHAVADTWNCFSEYTILPSDYATVLQTRSFAW